MATIRIKQGSDVTDFTDVNLESTVGDLRNRIREKLGIAADVGMKLVYGGQILKDTNTLSSYKIDDGKTIQLVVTRAKMETAAAAAAPATPAAAPAAQSSSSRPASASSADSAGSGINQGQLRALLQNPEGRRILQAMMSNPQLLAAVMQSNPELANNPEALAMLRNPEFLRMMADPDNIESNLAPSISREVFDVAIRCMNGEPIPANYPYAGRTVGGGDVPEGNGGEGEGEGEDDGDEMDTEGGDGEFHEFISRDQIRVALVEALGETNVLPSTPRTAAPRPAAAPQQQQQPPQPARESSRPRNPSSAAGAPAAAQAPAAAPAPAAQNPAVQYAAQLQQLRDMGFSDEAACLRALQATRGNVEAALGMLL